MYRDPIKEKTLKAVRGACCSANEKEAIIQRTIELYDKILSANEITEGDLLSLFFSITRDIDTFNPASALRRSGRAKDCAMMVFQEAAGEGSLPGTIRVLIHVFMAAEKPVQHIYIRGAEVLRPDFG